jgi:hypothetical protein
MRSFRIGSRIAWAGPFLFFVPFLTGAEGNGCEPGGRIAIGSGTADGGSNFDGSATCMPADCAGLAAPAIAKVCPDGTAVSATLCAAQGDGKCGWTFPACPNDACSGEALPCVACPYGSTGIGHDSNGCPTCPICSPPPDACVAPVCNLPNCAVGSTLVPQYGPDGCETCAICVPDGSGNRDPLVGSWVFSGNVPDAITVTLTFGPDNSFTMVETVAPPGLPAGFTPTSCVTTDTYLGTFAEGVAGSTNTLDLTFTGGTANAIVDCDAGGPGTPMTPDAVAAYRDQGLVPATGNNYTVTSTTLVLTPTSSNPPLSGSCAPSPCDHGLATRVTTFTKPD